MHRIDTDGNVNGLFDDGDPTAGREGTVCDAAWLTDTQETIANVIEGAGLALVKGEYDQLTKAIGLLTGGRLLNIQVFKNSGTYTPTPGTKSIIVDVQAPGGAGGGLAATSASSSGVSGSGSAGAYARGRYTSGFAGTVVTIGTPGAGVVNGSGGNGTTTSFGALVTCPGGQGALVGTVSSNVANGGSAFASAPPSGSGLLFSGRGPQPPGYIQVEPGYSAQPSLIPSFLGGTSYGYGGSGVYSGFSQPATPGMDGGPGLVIVYEFA